VSRHPYLDHEGPAAFAHRGGNMTAPENTLAAFEHAVTLGYRYLETDVHRSADGVLVAFHDPDLARTCGVDANIADVPWAEIAELRVDGVEPIPRMTDLLDRWPDHRFNIDCKSEDAVGPLIELVEQRSLLPQICVGSFSLKRLRTLRTHLGSGLLTSMAPSEIASLRLAGRLPGTHQRAAQVPAAAGRLTVVNERFIANARRAGVPVHVWTINDATEVHRLLDLGVDGVMTDDVAMLRDVMIERGVWSG
jgi:glycerophosphoryl diester phosphodiesterase